MLYYTIQYEGDRAALAGPSGSGKSAHMYVYVYMYVYTYIYIYIYIYIVPSLGTTVRWS